MKRITIVETRSGVLVVDGEIDRLESPRELAARSWSFNSLDKAIALVRVVLTEWRNEEAAGPEEE